MPPKRKGKGRGQPRDVDEPARDAPVGRGRGRNQQQRPADDIYQLPQHREHPEEMQAPRPQQRERLVEMQAPRPQQRERPVEMQAPRPQQRERPVEMQAPRPLQIPTTSDTDRRIEELTPSTSELQLSKKKQSSASVPLKSIEIEQKPKPKCEMAPRPPPGTKGRIVPLISNYYMLEYKDFSIYHYDVDIIFLRQERKGSKEGDMKKKKAEASSAEQHHAKGKSLMLQGKTAYEAMVSKETHLEHQQNRSPGKNRCREIFTELVRSKALQRYSPVYDGQKNVYTAKKLPFDGELKCEVSLNENDKQKFFQVVIKPVHKKNSETNIISLEPLRQLRRNQAAGIDMDLPQEIIMAFDTVMGHRNPPFDQLQVGRSFFMIDQRRYNLGNGMEIWFGYNQTVRLTERGPAVIINFSAKAFHKAGPVIDFASDVLGFDITGEQLNPGHIKRLEDALKKVRVEVNHMPYRRKYIVKGVTKMPAKDHVIPIGDSRMSVAEYFRQKYRQLRYPYLPCLHMRAANNSTFLPFEVCEVPKGQPVLGKLSGEMTSKMIRQTAITPENRFQEITKAADTVSRKSREAMDEFGLFMDLRAVKLDGRVLIAPAVSYASGGRNVAKPDPKGVWRMDGMQFITTGQKWSFVIISFAKSHYCRDDNLKRLNDTLVQTARSCGMGLQTACGIKIFDHRTRTREALDFAKANHADFAIVVLSARDYAHKYEEVKFIADVQMRLITQCLDENTVVKKFNPQVAGNVLLKVNSKLGGVNHALTQKPKMFNRPMIIFGADAIHSARGFGCPSIAAVVGSLDAHPSRYAVTCRVQENTDEKKLSQEIILDMKGMVKEILHSFKKNTHGKHPERIIFFRDGVSEGQFSQVLEQEVPNVQEACKEALEGDIPPITFIIVQKRHQTRFMPARPKDGIGRQGNIPPGTTVDTVVTHPKYFDFFLCSHEGIQGTSKPAHYTVLWDDNNFNSDDLQELCYHMCHTYVRCTRSISIPAPVMYADLACARAKKYADLYLDAQSTTSSGDGPVKLPPYVENAITGMSGFQQGMFYM